MLHLFLTKPCNDFVPSIFFVQDDRRDERNGRGGNGLFPCHVREFCLLEQFGKYMKESHSLTKRHIGVSKNCGTPKWMVYNGKPYSNWWFGGYHHFRKHPHQSSDIFPLSMEHMQAASHFFGKSCQGVRNIVFGNGAKCARRPNKTNLHHVNPNRWLNL